MKPFKILFFQWITLVATAILLAGCAGSKSKSTEETLKSEDDYIADLLGINQDSSQQKEDTSMPQGDDNLLELLQESDPGIAEKSNIPETTIPAKEPVPNLEKKINNLERQVQEKERTIDMLKTQVGSIEQTTSKPQTRSGQSAYTSPYSASSGKLSNADYKLQYQSGYDLWQSRRYRDAIGVFEGLLANRTDHSLSDNAQYWIGESYYALGDYSAAIIAFEKVFTFRNSNKNDYAQYKLGQCYFQMKETSRARQEFQTLIDNYKNSSLISKARGYMSRM